MDEDTQPKLALPDHTRIQLAAVVQAIIAVAVAFGAPISDQQSVALLALAGVLGTVLIGADASIRRERARNADKLRPQLSVSTTEGPGGTEVTTEFHAPLGSVEGSDEVDPVEQMVELLRRILREREPQPAAASTAPERKGRARRTATDGKR